MGGGTLGSRSGCCAARTTCGAVMKRGMKGWSGFEKYNPLAGARCLRAGDAKKAIMSPLLS
jgi:hypothetical protein